MEKTIVVGNNFLSAATNNGKTMKYLLSRYREEELVWVYCTPLETDDSNSIEKILVNPLTGAVKLPCTNYYTNRRPEARVGFKGTSLRVYFKKLFKYYVDILKKKLKSNDAISFLRALYFEIVYLFIRRKILSHFKGGNYKQIILVAGDFTFFHNLSVYLSGRLGIPLITFVTDDYLLTHSSRRTYSWRGGVFSKFLKFKFTKSLSLSSKNHFISEKMRDVYKQAFGVDGVVSFNASLSPTDQNKFMESTLLGERQKCLFILRYFGSLHSGRLEALLNLAKLIEKSNSKESRKIEVEVFTTRLCDDSLRITRKYPFISFKLPVFAENLEMKMRTSDGLLVIESAKPSNLKRTWLSFSTKITEYLRMEKPILTYGPMECPSIEFLASSGSSYHIESEEDLIAYTKGVDAEYRLRCSKNLLSDLLGINTLF